MDKEVKRMKDDKHTAKESAQPAPVAADLAISDAVTSLVLRTGIELGESVAAAPDAAASALDSVRLAVDEMILEHEMPGSCRAAEQLDVSQTIAYAAGALHGVREVLSVFQQALTRDESVGADADGIDGEVTTPRVCIDMGIALSRLQFVEGWVLLTHLKSRNSALQSSVSRTYMEGIRCSLQEMLTAFRATIEDRATGLVYQEQLSDEQRQLVVLIFVAVTGANSGRLEDSLGDGFAKVLKGLQRRTLVTPIRDQQNPPYRLTDAGVTQTRALLQQEQIRRAAAA